MALWLVRTARRYRTSCPGPAIAARAIGRHAAIMAVMYAVTVAATMAAATPFGS